MTAVFENPMQTDGFEFIEFAATDCQEMITQCNRLGFNVVGKHRTQEVYRLAQGDITFLVNTEQKSKASRFACRHGASVSAMGFRVRDAKTAFDRALRLGARAYQGEWGSVPIDAPAIYGIGESLIFFIDTYADSTRYDRDFAPCAITHNYDVGLKTLDHVTHNVFRGQMDVWAEFYERLFNFREIRYFDIKGEHTGLISRALTSPCGKIRIPLNESTDDKSQIEEFLHDYNGEGIQHIALSTENIYQTIPAMRLQGVRFLKVPNTYYEQIDARIPQHGENIMALRDNKILLDGSVERNEGLLLQIFTGNTFGPVFFEVLQRKGNEGFGEGNFRALFVAMELDQIQRGVLQVKA